MTVIHHVEFETWQGQVKRVNLLHPERTNTCSYETTIITGRNGSHKSTLLYQLVAGLAVSNSSENDLIPNPDRNQVLCISGSVADRFPQKELSGGLRSTFDVPHYTYVGQRVINNLLSKKAPLKAMLSFALSPSRAQRYEWKFFSDAHAYAGIRPSVKYFLSVQQGMREKLSDLIGVLQSKSLKTDSDRSEARELPHVSHAMAQWLLEEFTYDEFTELQTLVSLKRRRRIEVVLDTKGAHSEHAATNVLRLGLLTDLLRLENVECQAARSNARFSVLDLSSGEYHMLSTILAIGFGLDQKAVLLIDEPENNLHPQWQRDFMTAVFDICSIAMTEGHVIICTHSPLIVGSAKEGSTVVDLTCDEPQMGVVRYGASSDELLLAQFGVGSSRNKIVVDTIQRAVSMVERGDFNTPEFEALTPNLRSIRGALSAHDPLVDVIDALLDEEPVR